MTQLPIYRVQRRPLALVAVATTLLSIGTAIAGGAEPTAPSPSGSAPAALHHTKLRLPEERSKVAQAFLQRRPEATPAKDITPQVVVSDLADSAESTSEKSAVSDPAVQPAVNLVEPLNPNAARAMALLSVAREMALEARTAHDFTEVIEQCHRALDAEPDRRTAGALAKLGAWAYNCRGQQLVSSRERQAFDDFQEAILLDPTCWEALHNRAITLARYNKLDLAVADFTRVMELEPSFALARYNRAETYSQMKDWQRAIDDYTAVLRQMPDEAMVYAGRAHARHQLGKLEEAVDDYNRALQLDPSYARAMIGRAMVWVDQGQYEMAAAAFRDSLKIAPPTDATYRAVAWFLATCPDPQYRDSAKAIEAARRALALAGENDPASLDVMAAACASAGDFEQAVEHQKRAMLLVSAAEKGAYQYRLELYKEGQPYFLQTR